MKKMLAFLRHYNDIDHIVPVVYKWLVLDKGPVDLVITTDRAYLDDYRIQFLKRFDDLRSHFINDFLPDDQRTRLNTVTRVARLPRYHPARIALRMLAKPHDLEPQSLYNSSFIEGMLDSVFDGCDGGVIVFDWVLLNSPRQIEFVQCVSEAARRRGILVVALPHGDSPYHTWMVKVDQFDYGMLDAYRAGAEFDHLVVPNELCARRYRPHMAADRIKVLGSPRYNEEWLTILQPLLPAYHAKRDADGLKVVFFLRNFLYAIFWDEVIRTIQLITQFPGLHLVVKHHTRDVQLERLIQSHPELASAALPNLEFVYDEVHSGSLLTWADVAMDLGTSVVFEAIKKGKPVLAMEYLHAGTSTVAHYMETCAMRSRDDTYEAIRALVRDPSRPFYDENERARFIREVIEVPDANVLERYVDFLEQCSIASVGRSGVMLAE